MAHAQQIRGRALVVGQDAILLDTRRQLLSADGYLTDMSGTLQQVRDQLDAARYDVLVVCHSADLVLTQQILQAAEDLPEPLPVYRMLGPVQPSEFLDAVAQLTGNSPLVRQDSSI